MLKTCFNVGVETAKTGKMENFLKHAQDIEFIVVSERNPHYVLKAYIRTLIYA